MPAPTSDEWTAWEATQTPATFRAIFPEFTRASDAMISSRIVMAYARTESSVWGDLHAQGVAWLAAHLLCHLPGSQDMRRDSDGGTIYGDERDRLGRTVASGYRAAVLQLHGGAYDVQPEDE
jgi:hypothetical protein